jgi:hypothetical protein
LFGEERLSARIDQSLCNLQVPTIARDIEARASVLSFREDKCTPARLDQSLSNLEIPILVSADNRHAIQRQELPCSVALKRSAYPPASIRAFTISRCVVMQYVGKSILPLL